MQAKLLFKYDGLEGFVFEKLPKGRLFDLVVNPYNGNVFFKPEKHAISTRISLDLMRRIVSACDVLERNGSLDPLRDLLSSSDGFDWESLAKDADRKFKAFEGRSGNGEGLQAAGDAGQIRLVG